MQVVARRYDTGEPISITVEQERIARIDPVWPDEPIDNWPMVAPGLFDLQINGYGGVWFSKDDLTAEEVCGVLEPHFQFGVTRLCPTLITNSHEALHAGFAAIREACEKHAWVDAMVPGCHLEGPYISAEDGPRGAHPLEHVRAADWDEFCQFQEAAGGRIRLVTLAPDCEGAIPFIERAVASGVVISIGHTAATTTQIEDAVKAGARLSTHLGNGAHGTIRRHPNYIWDQLGQRRLSASVIADGHHLPGSVMRSIVWTKSIYRTIITCDAAGLAGSPSGVYQNGSIDVEVLEDGRIVLAGQDQLLAGSTVDTARCVARMIAACGVSLHEAIDMAGRNPARLLGFEQIGLRRGSRADFFLFRFDGPGKELEIESTYLAGQLRFCCEKIA